MLFAFLHRVTSQEDGEPADEVLIRRYRKDKDPRVLGMLFDRYVHLVYGVCLKYLKNEVVAEDAVMDVFASLFEKLLQHEITHFPAWLHRVTVNHCLMYLRRSHTKIHNREVALNEEQLLVMENQEEMHHNDREVSRELDMEKALAGLKEEQQQCLRLFYLEEKSYKEVAALTGMKLKTVKSHIQNGKRNLKLNWERKDEES